MMDRDTKGGFERLKTFLNEVMEDIVEDDDESGIEDVKKKKEIVTKTINKEELRKIREEVSESIKYDEKETLDNLKITNPKIAAFPKLRDGIEGHKLSVTSQI